MQYLKKARMETPELEILFSSSRLFYNSTHREDKAPQQQIKNIKTGLYTTYKTVTLAEKKEPLV